MLEKIKLSIIAVLIEHEMKINNIAVEKELQPDLPLIKGDFQLLQQVLFNMMINSRWAIQKKSQTAGGSIAIKNHYNKDAGCIFVSISDTSIGIPKENISRIFESFYTTQEVGTGTGLGLYLSYNIIKALDGNIEVESKVNKGTTFKITLQSRQ